jgi:NADH-quinone oxidoreductase subunit M
MLSYLLTGLLVLPLAGALFILITKDDTPSGQSNVRWIALLTTVATMLMSFVAWGRFDPANPAFQLVEDRAWLSETIRFKLGVDGFSMPFIMLTTVLMPFCIVASWVSVEKRVKEYFIAFLVLEALMIGVFAALDLVLFYLFFEAGLIPMFLIIGIWGGKRRIYASFKFFLYTLVGSLLMLVAIMAMYWNAARPTSRRCSPTGSRRACRPGCGSPSSPPSR